MVGKLWGVAVPLHCSLLSLPWSHGLSLGISPSHFWLPSCALVRDSTSELWPVHSQDGSLGPKSTSRLLVSILTSRCLSISKFLFNIFKTVLLRFNLHAVRATHFLI